VREAVAASKIHHDFIVLRCYNPRMDQNEMTAKVQNELDKLMPKALSEQEKAAWRMIYNALRLNDLSKDKPSGEDVVALHATVESIMSEDCGQKTFTAADDGKIVVVTCTSPKIDISAFAEEKKSLFVPWVPRVSVYQSHPTSENSLIAYRIDFAK
jgi:hypothetical protein